MKQITDDDDDETELSFPAGNRSETATVLLRSTLTELL